MNGGVKSVCTTFLRSPFCKAIYESDRIRYIITETNMVRTTLLNVDFKQLSSFVRTEVVVTCDIE